MNQALKQGEYFWVDIVRDGIALYELPRHELARPMPASSQDALEMAEAYYADWIEKTVSALSGVQFFLAQGGLKDAAFLLHQATERAYICFLLVRTLYFPRSHNIKFLRSLAEDNDPRLIAAWPRATKLERRRFELLKRAYVEARYSANYEISRDDLDALTASVRRLRDLVEQVSIERIEELRRAAGSD